MVFKFIFMIIAPLEIQRGLTEIIVRSNCRFCLFKNMINDYDMFNYFGHCPVGYQTCNVRRLCRMHV